MTTTHSTPRVWIGCLASYNAGRLIGEWVDATDVDELTEAQERVGKAAVEAAKKSGDYPVYFGDPEEFYIGDYDGFGSLASTLAEYARYEDVARVGELIESEGEVIIAWIETCEVDVTDPDSVTQDEFDRMHRGEWDSEESFAQHNVSEVGWSNVPSRVYTSPYSAPEEGIDVFDELSSYLDWQSIARELFRHGPYTYSDGHVFEAGA